MKGNKKYLPEGCADWLEVAEQCVEGAGWLDNDQKYWADTQLQLSRRALEFLEAAKRAFKRSDPQRRFYRKKTRDGRMRERLRPRGE